MEELRSFFPIVRKVLSCEDYKDCSSSQTHTIVLTRDNEVLSNGNNSCGQLGVGDFDNRSKLTPVLFSPSLTSKAIRVFTGNFTSAVITVEGALYTFGLGRQGQLGKGKKAYENQATLIPLSGRTVQVSFGYLHTAILFEDGRFLACGNNYDGQLGFGDKNTRLEPTETLLTGLAVDVKCSNYKTVITLENGKLVEFGKDDL